MRFEAQRFKKNNTITAMTKTIPTIINISQNKDPNILYFPPCPIQPTVYKKKPLLSLSTKAVFDLWE